MAYQIAVFVNQTPDMNGVKIDRRSGKAVLGNQLVISSFDEYAIEEALRLKEQHGGDVTVMSAGPASAKDAVSRALAMGADRGVLIQLDNVNQLDTLAVAGVLADQIRGQAFDIILLGQNSDDYLTGQVGPQLAELLDLPQVSSVTKVEANGSELTVYRDTEDGKQIVHVSTPVVLLAMTGLNEPRYPSLKGIMAAKKKPLEQVSPSDVPSSDRMTWSEPTAPERTASGTILQDVPAAEAAQQLVAWLKDEKLI